MTELTTLALSAWQNFYVIVGSSAGALIGVQFVVIALIADGPRRTEVDSINAFGTPTIVHFSGALVVSAIMSAPWPSLLATSIVLALAGVSGFCYAVLVFQRARRQKSYTPVPEDWFWYAILPCTMYAILTAAALLLRTATHLSLFVVALSVLILLLVGIHNAWDTVTYVVTTQRSPETEAESPK